MKNLRDILPPELITDVIGDSDIPVTGLSLDSRAIIPGNMFVALTGTQTKGSKYIGAAIEKGATAVLTNEKPEEVVDSVTYIISSQPAIALGGITKRYFENPTEKFELIGVTGTNGKTTTATLLFQLFSLFGYKCGLISTPGIWIHKQKIEATHTTPDNISLNRIFAEMADQECDFVFMEVSSHSIHQHRIAGLEFKGSVFTNLTHDHLDYHQTFDKYRDVKKSFFDGLDENSFALTNIDDKNGKFMLQNTKALKYTYALKTPADFKARIIEHDMHGMLLEIDNHEVYTQLSGEFNAYNILASYATARLLDIPDDKCLIAISKLQAPEGRFSKIEFNGIIGIVDYAHTPDALKNVLETIREENIRGSKIITVVGCGGDRDKEKRPVMARIATDLSDQVVLTTDNPRSEKPEDILKDMEQGVPFIKKRDVLVITDRQQAIRAACRIAKPGDIILLAGKGHEKYQEIKGVKYPFDDKLILSETLKEMAN